MIVAGRGRTRVPFTEEYANRRGMAGTTDELLERMRRMELAPRAIVREETVVQIEPTIPGPPGAAFPHSIISPYHIDTAGIPLTGDVLQYNGTVWTPAAVATGGGGAIYHADYVIDANYTGTDGTSVLSGTGSTSKLYSSLKPAVDDANINRQTAGQDSTFYIVGGDYTIATEIDCNLQEQVWWHFIGEGKDRVTLTGTMTTGNMIQVNSTFNSARASFRGMRLFSSQSIDLIDATVFGFLQVRDCHFQVNGSSGVGIRPGRSIGGGTDPCLDVSGCEFQGDSDGYGIRSGGGTEYAVGWTITNCTFKLLTFGIEFDNDAEIYIAACRFDCSSADIRIPTTSPSAGFFLSIVACEFKATLGIQFAGTANVAGFAGLSVTGCDFYGSSIEITQTCTNAVGCEHWTIIGNYFHGASRIRGLNVANGGPRYSTIIGNTFEGSSAGNEIVFCTHDTQNIGNVVHSNTTDSGAILPEMGHIQKGSGVPTHASGEGTPYWDLTNNNLYVNSNGSTTWQLIGGASGSPASPHNLLDGTTHPDTRVQGVSRGSIIVGMTGTAGGILWDELLGGPPGTVLQMAGANNLEPAWQFLSGSASTPVTIGGELNAQTQGADKLILPVPRTFTSAKVAIFFQNVPSVPHSFSFYKSGAGSPFATLVKVTTAADRWDDASVTESFTGLTDWISVHHNSLTGTGESNAHVDEGGRIWAFVLGV